MQKLSRALAAAGLLAGTLLASAAWPAPAAAEVPGAEVPGLVSLKRHVVVQQDLVTLGDLFTGLEQGADTPIGRAPAPGTSVRVDPRWLGALAQTYGIDWRPGSRLDTAEVERAALRLEAEELIELLQEAFLDRGESEMLELVLDEPAMPLVLPLASGARPGIVGLSRDPRGRRFTASLVYPDQGAPLARVTVSGRVFEMVEVPVAQQRLARDQVILAGDLTWTRVRADRLPHDAVLDPAELLGKAPRRNLRAGEAIRSGEVAEPVLVQKNSLVTLRLTTPLLRLSAAGRALEDGHEGATIRVMNTTSNTIVLGVVASDGSIAVSLDAARAIY